jgi:hypothetical protein
VAAISSAHSSTRSVVTRRLAPEFKRIEFSSSDTYTRCAANTLHLLEANPHVYQEGQCHLGKRAVTHSHHHGHDPTPAISDYRVVGTPEPLYRMTAMGGERLRRGIWSQRTIVSMLIDSTRMRPPTMFASSQPNTCQ